MALDLAMIWSNFIPLQNWSLLRRQKIFLLLGVYVI